MPELEVTYSQRSSWAGWTKAEGRVLPNLVEKAFEIDFSLAGVDDVLRACAEQVRALNKTCPRRRNSIAITKIEEAVLWFRGEGLSPAEEGSR